MLAGHLRKRESHEEGSAGGLKGNRAAKGWTAAKRDAEEPAARPSQARSERHPTGTHTSPRSGRASLRKPTQAFSSAHQPAFRARPSPRSPTTARPRQVVPADDLFRLAFASRSTPETRQAKPSADMRWPPCDDGPSPQQGAPNCIERPQAVQLGVAKSWQRSPSLQRRPAMKLHGGLAALWIAYGSDTAFGPALPGCKATGNAAADAPGTFEHSAKKFYPCS